VKGPASAVAIVKNETVTTSSIPVDWKTPIGISAKRMIDF
jgi:hypothetical protein